jgi:carbon storage regulator CsrA
MLILKRRIGQSFLIDGRILVKVLSTQRGSAVIGIQAPVAVPVLREEVAGVVLDVVEPKEEKATP